ncbi:hypothetical protein ACHQM5_006568 [Ranunculus cassubicifolius]
MDEIRDPSKEFSYGAGHINPVQAIDPGLVYDAREGDYIRFLCSIGIRGEQMALIVGAKVMCPTNFSGSPKDLNYPSILSTVAEASFLREVTNVGGATSTYKASVTTPPNLKIKITPEILHFKHLNEKMNFTITVSARKAKENQIYSASLIWTDGIHKVRSPIVMYINRGATQATYCSYFSYVVLLNFVIFYVISHI